MNLLDDSKIIGLLAGLETLDDEVLSSSNLKVVSRVGSGISNIDLDSIKKNNIKFYSTPYGPVDSVAELTVGNMINLLRSIIPMNNNLHNGNWSRIIGNEIKGKKILVVGFGRIGKKVAKILKALEAEIYISDPYIDNKSINNEYTLINLKEALSFIDIITVHIAGEECVISEQELSMVKKGIFICNASRGGTINEDALIKAVKENIIAGAWIDAFVEEPYYGQMNNINEIILTPHIGSYTIECRYNMEMEATISLLENL